MASDRQQIDEKALPQFESRSTVRQVREGSKSLKTTIPENIAELLHLENGSVLSWQADISGEQFIVTVEKAAKA